MLDTIMDHLDCWAHVTQKDHRKADKMEELNDRIQDETNEDDSDFEDWEDDIYDDFIDNGGQDHGNGGHWVYHKPLKNLLKLNLAKSAKISNLYLFYTPLKSPNILLNP